MRRYFVVSFLLLTIFAVAQVPSPEQFLGYKIGTRFTPHFRIVDYYKAIAAASPSTVKLQQYGTTNEGRPLLVAFVSSAGNLANLESIRTNNLAVVNTVLEENLPDHVQVGEVAQALDQSVEVEKQLSESVDRLQQVHDELGQSTGSAPPAKKG